MKKLYFVIMRNSFFSIFVFVWGLIKKLKFGSITDWQKVITFSFRRVRVKLSVLNRFIAFSPVRIHLLKKVIYQ